MRLSWATFTAISDHMPQTEHSWQTFKSHGRYFEIYIYLPDAVICSTHSNAAVCILLYIKITHQSLLHVNSP